MPSDPFAALNAILRAEAARSEASKTHSERKTEAEPERPSARKPAEGAATQHPGFEEGPGQ